MTYKISYLAGIFTSREASATIAIHWNIISDGHFPFFIANASTFTNTYVVVFRFWTKMNRYFEAKFMSHEYYKTNPWTWSGAPHLANGLCPFGITANLMWRPRHWAVWIDPGTNTWLLFRQNARQNVFNWVLCSHFSQFQTDKVHILGRNHYSQLKFTIAVWQNVWKLSLTPTVFLSMVHCSNIFGQSDLFAAIDFNSDDDWA